MRYKLPGYELFSEMVWDFIARGVERMVHICSRGGEYTLTVALFFVFCLPTVNSLCLVERRLGMEF